MAHSLGNSTTLFEGTSRKDGAHCPLAVDYVAVNGLCIDDRDPWASLGQRFWLEDWLLEPETRVLLVSNGLNVRSSFDDLLKEGDNLLRVVERFRGAPDIPLVFHCVGLGGIIFLKALHISETRDASKRLASTTTGVIFYGTPAAPQSLSGIKKTIRECFTVELHLERLHESTASDQTTEHILELLQLPEICTFETLSIFEKHESSWKSPRGFSSTHRKSKVLVPEHLAKLRGSKSIGLEKDHCSIARLDWQSYTTIAQRTKEIVARYRKSFVTLAPAESSLYNVTTIEAELGTVLSVSGPYVPTVSHGSNEIGSPSTYDTRTSLLQSSSQSSRLPVHKFDFPMNNKFVGRQDVLLEIDKELCEEQKGTSTRAFAIYGTAGVGKTQTALEFAYKHKDAFPSILWASSESRYKLIQSLSDYSILLGLVSDSSSPTSNADILMQWYSATDTPWLLIMDNAVDRSLILDFWPRNAVGAILITTQIPAFASPDLCTKGRELLQLDEDSAILLLQSSLTQSISLIDEDARTLVRRVGCLPVAIRTCIGQINEADCSLEEYNKQWNDARTIIKDADVRYVESLNARYDKGLRELWAVSFQNLNHDARALINVFSLLDDEHIPEELFKNEALYKQLPFLKTRVRAIRDLSQSSLIGKEIGKETGNTPQASKRFHIHRMTRTFAQLQMDPAAEQAAFDAAALLVNAAIVHENGEARFLYGGSYYHHVQALHDYYEATVKGETENGVLTTSIAFIQLLRKTSWWCYRTGFFGPGLSFIETINNAHDKPDLHPFAGEMESLEVEMVWNHYQHGAIQTELGDWQASYDCFTSALKCRQEAVEKGYQGLPREYVMHGGVGNACNGLGRHVDAERYYQKALDLRPENVRFQTYETNICLSLLAQGEHRYAEASQRCQAFVKRREELYGQDDTVDFQLGRGLYIFGNVRKQQAQDLSVSAEQRQQWLDDSYNFHARSLKVWKVTHGEEHHHTADACCRVAWHLTQRGNNAAAINLLRRALAVYRGPVNREYRKREIARATFMLSLAFDSDGQRETAETLRAEAELARKDILKEKFQPATGLESYDRLVSIWQL